MLYLQLPFASSIPFYFCFDFFASITFECAIRSHCAPSLSPPPPSCGCFWFYFLQAAATAAASHAIYCHGFVSFRFISFILIRRCRERLRREDSDVRHTYYVRCYKAAAAGEISWATTTTNERTKRTKQKIVCQKQFQFIRWPGKSIYTRRARDTPSCSTCSKVYNVCIISRHLLPRSSQRASALESSSTQRSRTLRLIREDSTRPRERSNLFAN